MLGICIGALGYSMFIAYKLEKERDHLLNIVFMCINSDHAMALTEDGEMTAFFYCLPL